MIFLLLIIIVKKGFGLNVEIYNISGIIDEMYLNVLMIVGVKDVKVYIIVLFEVFGIVVLIGLIKVYEVFFDEVILEDVK